MTAAGAGLSAAGPLWNEFMTKSLAGTHVEYFPKPNPPTTDKIMLNGNYYGQDGIHTRVCFLEFNMGEIKTLIGTTGVVGEGVDTRPTEYVIIAGLGKSKPAFMQPRPQL